MNPKKPIGVSLVIGIFLLLSGSILKAQYGFTFSGYILDLPIYSSSNKEITQQFNINRNQILNLTRIRLRPTLSLWENARINLEYETALLYFNNAGNLLIGSVSQTNRQIVDLTWTPISEKNYTLTHFIDRLYFKQGFDFGEVVIGRQRISWGTGRIWNPTDLFNPINPTTFYKIEKDGADAVSAKLYLGSFTDLSIVFNPQGKIKNSNYGFRFRTNFSEYDVSVIGGFFDRNYVVGLDFAGNLFDAGIRGEGIYSIDDENQNNNFLKCILGIDYQFTPELYALLEYHYNGEGKTDKSQYQFTRLISGEILNLSRNYLAVSAMYQVTPLFILTLSHNINLNDKSGYVGIIGNYSITSDIYVSLGGQLFYGPEFTEYWYYPTSVYLQGEFYF